MSSTPIVPITNSTLDDVEIRKRIATDINHRLVLQPQQQAAEEEARQALEEAKMSRMSIKEVKRYKEEQKKKLKEKEKIEKEQAKKKMQEQEAIRQLPLPQQKENYIRVGVQRLINRVDELKLVLFRVKNDGNCQFRAISHQLFGTDVFHDLCRYHIVSYMKKRRHDKFDFYFESPAHADKYYQEMGQLGTWGDELTLRAASDSLCTNIHVISSAERNFYITYRPDSDAPPPPSFLIDVVQVKELRRRQKLEARRKGEEAILSPATMTGCRMRTAAPPPRWTKERTTRTLCTHPRRPVRKRKILSQWPARIPLPLFCSDGRPMCLYRRRKEKTAKKYRSRTPPRRKR
ncbi:OTU-like cysteine protease, putative [Angomonas deanei]|uniref:OTU-like cysteine protease, putative n=1 Tax=Angomonas deanei TaxID=59799 RepID=A0A7G2CLM5_9TRYP|nr:OTU-like cysteine protease, putative [Angomonas deanei]